MNQLVNNLEHRIISGWVFKGASVLDLGCGNGDLLSLLIRERHIHAQGIDLSDQAIHNCIVKGLSVIQEDIDKGLSEYSNHFFDFVILNQTFQQVKKPDFVLKEALRVGKKIIVSFPNFLHIAARFQMFFRGKVPVTPSLPYEWHDTPNLHFLSIADFREFCKIRNIRIERSAFITKSKIINLLPNLLAETGFFLLSK